MLLWLRFWFSLLHDLSHSHRLHTKDVKFFTCLSERALDLLQRLMSQVRDFVRCLFAVDCLYPRDLPQPVRKKKDTNLWVFQLLKTTGKTGSTKTKVTSTFGTLLICACKSAEFHPNLQAVSWHSSLKLSIETTKFLRKISAKTDALINPVKRLQNIKFTCIRHGNIKEKML